MNVEFFYHDFNPDDKLKYFPSDFYYKPHFLFMFKIFRNEEEQNKATEYLKKMADVSNNLIFSTSRK